MRLKIWGLAVDRKPEAGGTFKAKSMSKETVCDHQSQKLQGVQRDKGGGLSNGPTSRTPLVTSEMPL